jgi:DNA-binding response OmpR family regulator
MCLINTNINIEFKIEGVFYMKRILVCEDEDVIRDFVVINLKRAGYDVVDVSCGEEALKVFEAEYGNFDIALLDIMMPGIDGFTVCKRLREKSSTLGIIMLSAKTQEMDKVSGLMIGADDYITKPFSPSELTARVDAIYRRVCMSFIKDEVSPIIESGPFKLNLKSRTVTKNDKLIDLTQVEYQILEYFMSNKNTALDRTSILNHIWGEIYFGDDKIVDVNIRRIRIKIEDEPSNPQYIITIWGYGYKWNDKN